MSSLWFSPGAWDEIAALVAVGAITVLFVRRHKKLNEQKNRTIQTTMTNNKPVERIAIIGAGIGGLSTMHSFVSGPKEDADAPIDVTVFEADEGLAASTGAGFLLNGALVTLGRINKDVQRAVYEAGNPVQGIHSHDPAGNLLADINFREVIKATPGLEEEYIQGDDVMCAIMKRGACQTALYNSLPDGARQRVKFGKRLVGIEPAVSSDGTNGAMCVFADGTKAGPFDLVVGADGSSSTVREYVDHGAIARDGAKRQGKGTSFYTGIRIRYCVREGFDPQEETPMINTYYGKENLYIFSAVNGAGKGKTKASCAYLVYKEKGNDPNERPKPADIQEWRELVTRQLREGKATVSKQVEDTLANATMIFELGVYYRDPYAPYYRAIVDNGGSHGHNGQQQQQPFCVLVGDSAHATPPFMGQGANNTVQDAHSLGLRIREYNRKVVAVSSGCDDGEKTTTSLQSTLEAYGKVRSAGMGPLVDKARFLGGVNVGWGTSVGGVVRDNMMRAGGEVGVSSRIMGDAFTVKL